MKLNDLSTYMKMHSRRSTSSSNGNFLDYAKEYVRYSGKYICIYAIAMLFDRSWWSFIVINNFRASSINYLAISRCLAGKWILHWPQPRLKIYFTLWSLFEVLNAWLLACNFSSVCVVVSAYYTQPQVCGYDICVYKQFNAHEAQNY